MPVVGHAVHCSPYRHGTNPAGGHVAASNSCDVRRGHKRRLFPAVEYADRMGITAWHPAMNANGRAWGSVVHAATSGEYDRSADRLSTSVSGRSGSRNSSAILSCPSYAVEGLRTTVRLV